MTRDQIIARAEAIGVWYHEIELVPGYVTNSCMTMCRGQWANIRSTMDKVDYKGKVVLDLGTMDGAWAFEAERRGAAKVIATDIYQHPSQPIGYSKCVAARFGLAKEALSSSVEYVPGGDVEQLQGFMPSERCFGIIQCLGILYHVKNPLLALANIRARLITGSIALLETAILKDAADALPVMRFNFDKTVYYDPTTYWIPNRKCLTQMLTLSGLELVKESWVDCVMPNANRVCFIAKAV